MTPVRVWCDTNPNVRQLTEFFEALRLYNVSVNTVSKFEYLSRQTPMRRLSINLRVLLTILADRQIQISNVLEHGLVVAEKAALVELDLRSVPLEARQIAHGLFNVHERWKMLKTMAKALREAEAARNSYITEMPGDPNEVA